MKIADVIWQLIVAGILSYLFGNINSAVIISKKFKHQDIRQQGSKNPGTTNMLRVFGMKIGAITLICDVVKGIVPVLAAHFIFKAMGCAILTYRFAMYFCAFCVTIGHVFPVFMKFRGGKGFATSVGVFLVLQPIPTLIILTIGLVVLLIWDRMSVFALLYVTLELSYHAMYLILGFDEHAFMMHEVSVPILIIVALIWCLVVYAHRGNILRLIKGVENPSGLRKSLFKKKNKLNTSENGVDTEAEKEKEDKEEIKEDTTQ